MPKAAYRRPAWLALAPAVAAALALAGCGDDGEGARAAGATRVWVAPGVPGAVRAAVDASIDASPRRLAAARSRDEAQVRVGLGGGGRRPPGPRRARAGRAVPHDRRRRLVGRHPAVLARPRAGPGRPERRRVGAGAARHRARARHAHAPPGPAGARGAHPHRRRGAAARRGVERAAGRLVDRALRRAAPALEGADGGRAQRPRPRPRPAPLPPGRERRRGGARAPRWPSCGARSPAAGRARTATRAA